MAAKTHALSQSCGKKDSQSEAAIGQSIKKVQCGDLLWVQLRSSSWWPGQIVDESTVSASARPKKATAGEVLVRLYGSYEYLYVDAVQYSLKFEYALKRYNGEQTCMLMESLGEDLHELKFPSSNKKKMKPNVFGTGNNGVDPSRGRISKARAKCQNMRLSSAEKTSQGSPAAECTPKSSANSGNGLSNSSDQESSKKQKKRTVPNNIYPSIPNSSAEDAETTGKSSQRRLKVMRALGLIAPVGSPFAVEECICSTSLVD